MTYMYIGLHHLMHTEVSIIYIDYEFHRTACSSTDGSPFSTGTQTKNIAIASRLVLPSTATVASRRRLEELKTRT